MPALHARLLALIDQCVSRCAQVTQLPAAPSSQSHAEHTEDEHRETTETTLVRASTGEDCNPAELIDAASAVAVQAIGDGGDLDSASVAADANASASALATSGAYVAHNVVCCTLRPYEQYLIKESENTVTFSFENVSYWLCATLYEITWTRAL